MLRETIMKFVWIVCVCVCSRIEPIGSISRQTAQCWSIYLSITHINVDIQQHHILHTIKVHINAQLKFEPILATIVRV